MNPETYEIIELILKLVVTLVVVFVIPTIKKYLDNRQLPGICESAVTMVEQIAQSLPNECKKELAMEFAIKACKDIGIEISEDRLSDLIEAMVFQVKKLGK